MTIQKNFSNLRRVEGLPTLFGNYQINTKGKHPTLVIWKAWGLDTSNARSRYNRNAPYLIPYKLHHFFLYVDEDENNELMAPVTSSELEAMLHWLKKDET